MDVNKCQQMSTISWKSTKDLSEIPISATADKEKNMPSPFGVNPNLQKISRYAVDIGALFEKISIEFANNHENDYFQAQAPGIQPLIASELAVEAAMIEFAARFGLLRRAFARHLELRRDWSKDFTEVHELLKEAVSCDTSDRPNEDE